MLSQEEALQGEPERKRILVVDDDEPVADLIRIGLETEEYAVDVAANGEAAQVLAAEHLYDLIVLDLNLPGCDGLDVLRSVRSGKKSVPVLILTVRSQVEDRVRGLDLGADDYLAKPFSFAELAARVRALTRRAPLADELVLRVEDLEVDRVARTAKRGGRTIALTAREFALLECLARHAGHCVTRTMILKHVWSFVPGTRTNVVEVYINNLRQKIDVGFGHRLIRTVRGVGYQLGDSKRESEDAIQRRQAAA